MSPLRERYDVVVTGGALAGASTALLLLRERPELSVLVVEKSPAFDSRVGEATTEMAGMFLTRRLALWEHLEREHLPKEGLRYWFSNDEVRDHAGATETGGFVRSLVPSFQLRRDVLDEHVLGLAVEAGAELARPARVTGFELAGDGRRVTLDLDGERREVACRWIVDASGRATLVGRHLGLIEKNDRHPTAAMWCRWSGVAHLDDLAARRGGPLAERNVSSRRLATNHYTGRGWWAWFIPLGNGETSIGVVWDKRLVDLDARGDRAAAYERFVREIVPANELLENATPRAGDFRAYSSLAYVAREYAGDGWALVGDAAAFLDPYYSPGLDHVGFSVEATVGLVLAGLDGELDRARIDEHNETFRRSYWRFFEAIYDGKYRYMGEADLLSAAMLCDTAQYYIFVVIPAYKLFRRFHWMPVLGPKPAFFAYHLMRLYHARFRSLADLRLEMGEAGRRNHGRRIRAFYDLGWAPWRMALRAIWLWLKAELDGLRLLLKRALGGAVAPRPGAAPPKVRSSPRPTD